MLIERNNEDEEIGKETKTNRCHASGNPIAGRLFNTLACKSI